MSRLIFYRPASFKGKHNSVKVKCFLFMSQHSNTSLGWRPAQLSTELGLPDASLYVLLGRWYRWKYVGRIHSKEGFRYTITKRGRDWLERNGSFAPIDRYIAEIESYRARRRQLFSAR